MSADPLSFFAVNDNDDSASDSDSDTEQETYVADDSKNETRPESHLPAPLTALAQAKTPEFVTSHIKYDMDWDKMIKAAPYVPPKEFKPWETTLPSVESKSTAKSKKPDLSLVKGAPQTIVPVPPKMEPKNDQPVKVIDHAVTWSKIYKDSGFDSATSKRPRPEDDDEDLAGFCHTDLDAGKVAFQSKHLKTSNVSSSFSDKEKRKRDAGQSNRDKSFVEEEKRILRQGFDDE